MSDSNFDDIPIESQLAATRREIDKLQKLNKSNEILLTRLIGERDFLLPHATRFILERQLCLENQSIQDARETFEVLMKLVMPDMTEVIDMVAACRRVDLLEKLMENKNKEEQ